MTPLAEAVGLTRRFGAVVAVERADLCVERGEVVGLLGANGAGKTTLVRALLGLVTPTSGEVRLFGAPPCGAGRRRVGYVPQGLGLYDDLSVRENLAFSRAVYGTRHGPPTVTGPFAERLVGELPLGLQRQAAFAEALDHHPDLLVLDEPTSGVAPLGSARLWDTVRAATEAGAGALVTTHNLEEAEQCDRLVVMAAGRVVVSGTLGEIVGTERAVVVRCTDWVDALGALEAAGAPVALVGRTLRVAGLTPDEVRRALGRLDADLEEQPATLEERFAALVAPSGPGV